MSNKCCDTCRFHDGCDIVDALLDNDTQVNRKVWNCSRYEPEKKKLKLYAYLRTAGLHKELYWSTHHHATQDGYGRVPSEDKEITI